MQAIKTDANFKQLLSHHPARQLLSISTQLSIEKLGETEVIMLDGNRILVPKGARKNIIRELHRAPSGLTKTFKTAKQLNIWPNMKEELRKAIDKCQHCQEDRPAQARPTLNGLLPSASSQPMLHVASDPFDLNGDVYSVLVNRYLGKAWTEKLRRTDTQSICESLTRWFTELGWPSYIRTDGGPHA